MTQQPGHASGGVTKTAPRLVAVPATSIGSVVRTETGSRTPSWDDLFRSLPLTQQQDLLTLAQRQGLLYSHQLPTSGNGSTSDQPRTLLTKVLSGRLEELAPLHPPSVAVADTALDATQREAVAGALHTPDFFLLKGLPGTGKSRVVAEILTQATLRGERVLLLAPTVAALDRVLERVANSPTVCAVRCLERGEKPDTLSVTVRALTYAEQVRALREQAVQTAQASVGRQARHTQRLRQDEAIWPRLEQLARARMELDLRREDLRQRSAHVADQVEHEAAVDGTQASASVFAKRLRACTQAHHEALGRYSAQLADLQNDQALRLREFEEWTAEKAKLRPLAEARQTGHWWTMRWWQATVQGVDVARWSDLEERLRANEEARTALQPRLEACTQAREAEQRAYQLQREQLLAEEVVRRRTLLDQEEAALDQEQSQIEGKWQLLERELATTSPRPAAMTAEAVLTARAAWEPLVQRAAEQEVFATRWAEHLAQTPGTLAERLPEFINVVAATTSALASDPHFGIHTPGTPFDLLILDEAEQVTESEFLNVARRARRWVLSGEPHDEESGRRPAERAVSEDSRRGDRRKSTLDPRSPILDPRSSILSRLWQRLHFDPSSLPYAWLRENNRLVCRLRSITAQQRAALEIEHVADFPDIELRILNVTDQPTLVEVAFPLSMSIGDAKKYIYHELQELPLRASSHRLCWVEDPQRLTLHLADAPAPDPVLVALEEGVREFVGTFGVNGDTVEGPWYTCSVEFDREAGWHRQRAEEWLARHAGVRDLGRTARLTVHYRMNPDLALFAANVLSFGGESFLTTRSLGGGKAAVDGGGGPAVEFVPVPGLFRERGPRSRERERAKPVDVATALAHMRGGAGLELSLEDGRHRDRIPTEVRATLPAQGLVNFLEAQAVVRVLAALAQDRTFSDALATMAAAEGTDPTVSVLALYPAQAQLIRQLAQQEPQLATARFRLDIDVPAAYRQREALVVLLSLTRSHTHRAVPFGDGPHALTLALSRARLRLLIFGDPGTLVRRTQWEGALDHLDAVAATREREIITHLVRYLQGHGSHPQVFTLREGNPA